MIRKKENSSENSIKTDPQREKLVKAFRKVNLILRNSWWLNEFEEFSAIFQVDVLFAQPLQNSQKH